MHPALILAALASVLFVYATTTRLAGRAMAFRYTGVAALFCLVLFKLVIVRGGSEPHPLYAAAAAGWATAVIAPRLLLMRLRRDD